MSKEASSLATIWDVWRAPYATRAAFAERQRVRLASLIAFARNHSPYYRALYETLPPNIVDLRQLPVVSKRELMARFDRWATEPAVTRASVEAFVADPALIGHDFLDRYTVWTTSGTTGRPGIFLHDQRAIQVYQALVALRFYRVWMMPRLLYATLRQGWRTACIFATGGHYGSIDLFARMQRSPLLKDRVNVVSVLDPLPEHVRALNVFQPAVLAGYPSALGLLADEQIKGTLRIKPTLVTGAGEPLNPAARAYLGTTFNAPVYTNYGATEAPHMAFDCPHGRLHVNADWYILEPVDRDFQPVPPGQPSHTVLLTNLANFVQPIIRYNLGDSITVSPEACPCGSRLPVIDVIGRTNDVLSFQAADGTRVRVLPLALGTVIEETPGVQRFQAIKTAPATLSIRLEATSGADEEQVWASLTQRLSAYLSAQGIAPVEIVRDPQPPRANPVSGKYRQVWSAIEPELHNIPEPDAPDARLLEHMS